MAKSHPMTIDLSSMIQAARNLVFTARRQNQLESLTVKSVRTQVIRDFGLDETISEREDIKVALRDAVRRAVSEELPPVTKPVEKRKRAIGGADDTEDSVSQRDSKQKVVGKEGKRSRKKSRVVPKTRKVINSDADDTDSGSSFKAKPASTKAAKQSVRYGPPGRQTELKFTPAPEAEAVKSESELSVLINEPKKPVKKKAKGEKRTVSQESKSTKEKEPSQVLDEDETTIKRLKPLLQSFVTACGVRKVWSKEFADLPLAKHQIKHLKEVLADIGMTGKYSMEKAKAIKAKRELARELDDVVQFERKAGVSRSGRREITKAKRSAGELDTESEAEEGSEDEASSNFPAAKGKNTASRSIMAYLATQSSEED